MNRSLPVRRGIALSVFCILVTLLAVPAAADPGGAGFNTGPDLGSIPLGVNATVKIVMLGGASSLALDSGTLPPGMQVLSGNQRPPGYQANEAALFGTPSAAGSYTFVLSATAGIDTATQSFQLTVVPLRIANAGFLPKATAGSPYSYAFVPQGTTGSVIVAPDLNHGPLPGWLTLAEDGRMSGTPTAEGGHDLHLTARDSAGNAIPFGARLEVDAIAGPTVLVARVGQPFSETFTTVWGQNTQWGPLWLPDGLSFDTGTGEISGTPTQSGNFHFNLNASNGSGLFAQKNAMLVIVGATPGPLSIGPWQRDFSLGESVSDPLRAEGGVPPYRWTHVSGTLPPGLILESPEAVSPLQTLDGILKGYATQPGTYEFTVQVEDSDHRTATRTFTVVVSPILAVVPWAPPAGTPEATQGQGYSYYLAQAGTGSTPPYVFDHISGSLPAGITLNRTTGELSGVPLDTGNYWPWIRITDSTAAPNTQSMVRRSYGMFVRSAPVSGSTYTVCFDRDPDLGMIRQDAPAWIRFNVACGGAHPFTFTTPDPPPPGLTFQPDNGGVTLSGNPTQSGTFTFRLLATDNNGVAGSRTYTLRVSPIGFQWSAPLDGVVTYGYNTALTASGGSGSYVFSIANGVLPPGLGLSAQGVLSGTPTTSGSYSVLVRAVDSNNNVGETWLNFNITQSCQYSLSPDSPTTFPLGGGQGTVNFSSSNGCPVQPASSNWITINGAPFGNMGGFNYQVAAAPSSAPRTGTITLGGQSITITQQPMPVAFQNGNGDLGTFSVGQNMSPSIGVAGEPPFTFQHSALPAGLYLLTGKDRPCCFPDSDAVLYGIPTATGNHSFSVTVTGSDGSTATQTFTIHVTPIYLKVWGMPDAYAGRPYNYTLPLAGYTGTLTVSAPGQPLPQWLHVDPSGNISGTPPAPGRISFFLMAQDSNGNQKPLSFELNVSPVRIDTPGVMPNATTGQPYSQTLQASGGTPGYTWGLGGGGNLPPGLTLNNGTISGTPTEAGSWSFQMTASDSQSMNTWKQLSIAVLPPGTTNITTADIQDVSVGENTNFHLNASGGVPPYNWTVTGGTLPPGIYLENPGAISPAERLSAILYGAAQQPGTYSFTVQVEDSTHQTASRTYTMLVSPIIAVDPFNRPNAVRNQPYEYFLKQVGGSGSYTYEIVNGSLPAGLNFNQNTGRIWGTPVDTGMYQLWVRISDTSNPQNVMVRRTYSVFVCSAACNGNTVAFGQDSDLGMVSTGAPVNMYLMPNGGVWPYTFSVDPQTLPPGLSVTAEQPQSTSAVLSGTATTTGLYTFQVVATDQNGTQGARTFTLRVTPISFDFAGGPMSGAVGQPFLMAGRAAGGTAPYIWSLLPGGALPLGITLTPDGRLSGTPTQAGRFGFTVRVADTAGNFFDRQLGMEITGFSFVSNRVLPSATVGANYQYDLQIAGTPSGPVTFQFTGGMTPLILSPSGHITGMPQFAGYYEFNVEARDGAGNSIQRRFAITVLPASPAAPLAIAGSATLYLSVGANAAEPIPVEGGVPPYTVELASGSLPSGLSLGPLPEPFGNPGVAYIAGVPSATGTSDFVLRITDAASTTYTRAMRIVVSQLRLEPAELMPMTFDAPYQSTFAASGGTSPYTFTLISGTWPQGIGMSQSGVISGTPLQNGKATVRIRVADQAGNSFERDYTLDIWSNDGNAQGMGIGTPPRLPDATVGVVYQLPLNGWTSAGTPVWHAGNYLPPGLKLLTGDALPSNFTPGTTLLSGILTQPGVYRFTLQLTDPAMPGASVQRAFLLLVSPLGQPARVLPDAYTGENYSYQLEAPAGATGPATWRISYGSTLPAGWTLSASGLLSGTGSTTPFSFTAEVTSGTATLIQDYFVGMRALHITSGPELPNATAGVPYEQTLTATGGTAPYTWQQTFTNGIPGLTLSPDGVLRGSPSTRGLWALNVQVRDAAGASVNGSVLVNILSGPTPLSINAAGPWTVSAGKPNTFVFNAVGGATPYTWSVLSGSLPAGLSLKPSLIVPNNMWSSQWGAAITGTPTVPGTAVFTLQVRDNAGRTATREFTINVSRLFPVNSVNGSAVFGSPYRAAYSVDGGTPPYTFLVAENSLLPEGLQLVNGVLSGTPAETGFLMWKVEVRDSATPANTFTLDSSLSISPASGGLLNIDTPKRLPQAIVGVPFVMTVFPDTASWAPVGSLPAGLTLDGNALYGVFDQAGSYKFTLQATDGSGAAGLRVFVLDVSELGIATLAFDQASVGVPYRGNFYPTGGRPPFRWELAAGSRLPAGLTFANGTLEGVPSESGWFQYAVMLIDGYGRTTTQSYGLSVSPIRLTTARTLPNGVVNQAYSVQFAADGGTPPYTFSFPTGSGVDGLNLTPEGVLSGSPLKYGTQFFDVAVMDSAGRTSLDAFGFSVLQSPPTALRIADRKNEGDLSVGDLVTEAFYALGGAPPYSFTLAAGTLPPGMELIPADRLLTNVNPGPGWLTGVPRVAGVYAITLRVTDAAGSSATKQFNIRVSPMRVAQAPKNFNLNQPYNGQQFVLTGGRPPYTWEMGGAPPVGLAMAADGRITGTPLESGAFTVTFLVTDSIGQTLTRTMSLRVNTPSTQIIEPRLPLELPAGQVNAPFSYILSPQGGTPPYTVSFVSSPGFGAPAGIGITGDQQGISGTPTQAGRFPVLVRVEDSASNFAVKAVTMIISPLAFGTQPLPAAVFGSPYSAALQVTGGTAPYLWTLPPGTTLPQGLTLNASGTLSGTPAALGTFSFPVVVRDSATPANSLTRLFQVEVVATPMSGCVYKLSAIDPVPAAGGPASFRVTPNASLCKWQVERNVDSTFATVTSGASGTGEGVVAVQLDANTSTTQRSAALRLTGTSLNSPQAISIRQYGAEETCHYVVKPGELTVSSAPASTILNVYPSAASCQVTASSNQPWLTVVSATENRYVEISIAANAGDQRTASLTIGDLTVPVTQEKTCTVTLGASSGTISAAGGVQTLSAVTNPQSCAYAVQSDTSWLTVVSTGGEGITYSVAPNSSTRSRQGSIRAGEQTFEVSQAGAACSFSLRAGARMFSNQGGSGTIAVSTQDEGVCNWTATAASNGESWLSLTSGTEGTGTGNVEFTLVPNLSTEAREGTITVAGQQLRIVQYGVSCNYVLRGGTANMPFSGGSDSVDVVMPAGCPLAASSNAGWLTAQVQGSSVAFQAQKNTSAAPRTGTITVQGRPFTVQQAGAPCVFTVDMTSFTTGAAGGTVPIRYNTLTAGCSAPEVVSFDGWIRIAGPPAAGIVNLEIAANGSPLERSGGVSVGGRMIAVRQAAAVCSYAISPFSNTFGRSGGIGDFSLAASPAACGAPEPAPLPNWITFTQTPPLSATGVGVWLIPFQVDPFPAATRSTRRAYINVGGRSFTVRQFSR